MLRTCYQKISLLSKKKKFQQTAAGVMERKQIQRRGFHHLTSKPDDFFLSLKTHHDVSKATAFIRLKKQQQLSKRRGI
jgi:hypothetical protein